MKPCGCPALLICPQCAPDAFEGTCWCECHGNGSARYEPGNYCCPCRERDHLLDQERQRASRLPAPSSRPACVRSRAEDYPNATLPILCEHTTRKRTVTRRVGAVGSRDLAAYKKALICDPCSYCGAPAEVLDHIEPRARGGADRLDNLTPACNRCNQAKKDRSVLSFFLHRRLRISERRRELDELASAVNGIGRVA